MSRAARARAGALASNVLPLPLPQKYWHKGAFFQSAGDGVAGDDDQVVATVRARNFECVIGAGGGGGGRRGVGRGGGASRSDEVWFAHLTPAVRPLLQRPHRRRQV